MRQFGLLLIMLCGLALPSGTVRADPLLQAAPVRISVLPVTAATPTAAAVTRGSLAAAFRPANAADLVFARRGERWYRIQLDADWNAGTPPLLVVHNARFQPVTLYAPPDYRPQVQHHAQHRRDARFSRRALVYELPHTLRADQAVYLQLPPSGKRTPFTLQVYPEAAYHIADVGWTRVMVLFESVQFTMLLVGLTLWAALRQKLYGYFVGYLAPQFVYLLIASGDIYLLPGTAWMEPWGIRLLWFVAALSTPFALSFIIEFAELRTLTPRYANLLAWLRLPFLALAGTALLPMSWHHGSWQADIGNLLFMLGALAAIGAVTLSWRRGSVAAGVFLLAWMPQSLFTALRAGQLLLQLPLPGWLEFGVPAALALSGLVLTMGLGLATLQARRERDRARQEARHDPLTGLYNRRALMPKLAEALTEARQGDHPLTLLFLDIDHFKAINDRYGHLVGDACLKAVAAAVGEELRQGDVLARWGGEEFVALLPGASPAVAIAIGERIRQRVDTMAVRIDDQPVAMTVSIGIAGLGRGDDSPEQLIQRADVALYRAKADGRNRLVLHPGLVAMAVP